MKKILLLSFVIFLTFQSFPQNKFFSTKGKDIIDLNGNPILLKGINLGNWLVPEGYMFHFKNTNSPKFIDQTFRQLIGSFETEKFWKSFRENYITKEDISFIKKCGFNSVRVPFNYRLFVSEDNVNKLEGPGYQLLDNVIKWCSEENVYVILDMHCAPEGQTGDNIDDSDGYPFLFDSPQAQELTAKIWGKLASIYVNEKIVIGYDLLNEPIATYFDSKLFNHKLEPLYKNIVAEIRKNDNNHICILGGAQWDSNFEPFGKPFDDKLVYTFHKYWTEPVVDVIQSYIDFSNKYNVPIWMGESGENTDEWIEKFRTVLEKNNIGWCFWPYKKLDSPRNIVSANMPEDYNLIIKFAEADRSSYEKIRNSKPSTEKVKEILSAYLNNIKLSNCKINHGYLEALGLSAK